MYLNRAIVVGNLTRDPEMRALPSGGKVVSMSVATERVWNDREKGRQSATEFHNCVVFGKQAELCAQYLKKGQQVLVEGRLQTRSWDDQSGQKKYRTEIVADRVQFGAKRDGSQQGGGSQGAPKSATGGPQPGEDTAAGATIQYPEEEVNPDDIPF